MDLTGFRASLSAPEPPALSPALRALWLDARGNWDGAHEAAQADESGAGDKRGGIDFPTGRREHRAEQ